MAEEKKQPRYPIFIPTKGRADIKMTAWYLRRDGVPFKMVVEPQDYDAYAAEWGSERLLTLPYNDRGLVFARNWIWDYAEEMGVARHWQIDDNIRGFVRRVRRRRIPISSSIAIRVLEDFVDRYENVALAGFNYTMFIPNNAKVPPFFVNRHVYSTMLIETWRDMRFRGPANEDVDLGLQVIARGLCTVAFNIFTAKKVATMTIGGGQTDKAYGGDGRLFMARVLERSWPGVVWTGRRYHRPQHYVADAWKKFDTPLKLREGVDLKKMERVDEYGMELKQVKEIQSKSLQEFAAGVKGE